jgi:hypothetical protein
MVDIAAIQKKLLELDYAVVVRQTPNGCSLSIPNVTGIAYITTYGISRGKLKYTTSINDEVLDNNEFPVPDYAIKSIVYADIILKCLAISYNPAVVIFFIDDELVEEREFFAKLPMKISGANIKKSVVLEYLVDLLLHNGRTIESDGIAAMNKVTKGYKILLDLIEVQNDGESNDLAIQGTSTAISGETTSTPK